MQWHKLTCQETLEKLSVTQSVGLTTKSIEKRKQKYGENILAEEKPKSFLKKLGAQFSDFMVITLIVAAAVSLITSFMSSNTDYIDSIIIISIVIINALIGIFQESQAEKSIQMLKNLSTPLSKVRRNGKITKIQTKDIVPGDILILKTGDLVSADARVLKENNLATEESALTGESISVNKNNNPNNFPRKNILFAGSIVTHGNGEAVVIKTGMNTEIGKIAHMINKEKSQKTPLQLKLAHTGKLLGIIIIFISILVFILGVCQNADPLEMFMISISLAVAAIPEGLPAVVTIVLASGVKKMAKNNVIVRKLPAIEAIGHVNVICSDKTGTLTTNKMTVNEICDINGSLKMQKDAKQKILSLAMLCNNSEMITLNGCKIAQGEPTENALLETAEKSEIKKSDISKKYPRIHEIPFDAKSKIMTTIHKMEDEQFLYITKGAPDVLLNICSKYKDGDLTKELAEIEKSKIKNQILSMASQTMRVIGISYCTKTTFLPESAPDDLIFCGLIGIIDPPRPEAKFAVKKCKNAGIKPVMITGDHIETAQAIATQLGILHDNQKSITGNELNKLTDEQLSKNIMDYSVFARVSPADKVRIVKAYQSAGNIVAMTGDGVNDAPALKAADIGCAMGKSGTDAAKAASDLILTDDNFATIVEAVRQGRGIYENIKKTIHFLLSTNISEVMVVLIGFLIKIPNPLLAIHLLWINLITDAFPALALGIDPIDKNIMSYKSQKFEKKLFSNSRIYNILVEGCFIASIGLLAYSIGRTFFDINPYSPIIGQTMAFAVLGISQLIHAFDVQSSKSIFKTGVLTNIKLVFAVTFCVFLQIVVVSLPSLATFFKVQPPSNLQWLIIWILSLTPPIISEIEKRFSKNR